MEFLITADFAAPPKRLLPPLEDLGKKVGGTPNGTR
jgi:hypothetical protein